jgi:hypothetical protein
MLQIEIPQTHIIVQEEYNHSAPGLQYFSNSSNQNLSMLFDHNNNRFALWL